MESQVDGQLTVGSILVGDTSIGPLPPQLLTHILSQLSTKDRLCSCALVSRAWHKAALAATTSITGSRWPSAKVDNLSGWLAVHGAATAVSSIKLAAEVHPPPLDTFILPNRQLTSLRSLDLCRLAVQPAAAAAAAVAVQDVDDTQAPLPVLTQELSALTHLSFNDCLVSLEGLNTMTDLRSLALRYSPHLDVPHSLHSRSNAVLTAALLSQPQLAALELHGQFCNTAVMAAAGVLPTLQSLSLAGNISAANLGNLPVSLTCFQLEHWQAEDVPTPSFTAAATPRLCQLTALQELCLQHVGTFHPVVLADMRELHSLCVWCNTVDKGKSEPGLEVLTRFERLQSIHLRYDRLEPDIATAEGIVALTFSTELTRLDVLGIPIALVSALFPEGRRFCNLLDLAFDEQFLLQSETLSRGMIETCSNLTRLVVHAQERGQVQDGGVVTHVDVVRGLQHLALLQHLQDLQLEWCPMNATAWEALALFPSLKHFRVSDWELSMPKGILAMTKCRGLTQLEMELYPAEFEDLGARFVIDVQNKALPGHPPDVWCRLPAAVNKFALELTDYFSGEPDDEALALFRHLTVTAADVMGSIQAEQQQEVLCLRERTAALKAAQRQQQQETATLQRQLLEMQAATQQPMGELQAAMQQLLQDRG